MTGPESTVMVGTNVIGKQTMSLDVMRMSRVSPKSLLVLIVALFAVALGWITDGTDHSRSHSESTLAGRSASVASLSTCGVADTASSLQKSSEGTGIASLLRQAQAVGIGQKYALIVNGPLGPNDGEPLKIESTFTIRTGFQNRGHLIITGFQQGETGTRFDYINTLTLPENRRPVEDPEELREVRSQLDLSLYGREEFNLSFYLFNEHYSEVVAHSHWRGRMVFPRMIYLPREAENMPDKFPMLLDGRTSDKQFVIVRGNVNQVEVLEGLHPGDGYESLGEHYLSHGEFRGPMAPGMESPHDYQFETAPRLDSLFKIHGWNTVLILWTYHPDLGWARSAVMKPWDELVQAHLEKPPCEESVGVNACK